jgi:glyoxylase-like metal-dependent hydrolase (beta-lactamase superfamily II)
MMTFKKLNIFLLLLFLLVLFLSSASGKIREKEETVSENNKASVIKLADSIYRITFPYSLRPNIAALTGSDGVLLVDTGHRETAEELISKVKDFKSGDLKYIINTHLHGDHAGGNLLVGKKAEIIHYQNLKENVKKGVLFLVEEEQKERAAKLFGKYYALNFNGEKIKIIAYPGIHSGNDLIIYFSNSGVAHMGDLLLTQSFPAVGPRVQEYLEFLEKVMAYFPPDTKFIGGHGRDYSTEDLKKYHQMLLTTIEIVCQEIKKGRSVEEIKSANVLERWKSWGEFLTFLNTDYWIGSICKSYE